MARPGQAVDNLVAGGIDDEQEALKGNNEAGKCDDSLRGVERIVDDDLFHSYPEIGVNCASISEHDCKTCHFGKEAGALWGRRAFVPTNHVVVNLHW